MSAALSPLVQELQSHLTDQPVSPLKPAQVRDREDEVRRLEAMATAPQYVTGQNRNLAASQARKIREVLATQAPQPITGLRENTVKRLADAVLQDVIRPGMLTRAEMQRNPAGAVGKHLRQEAAKPQKTAIFTWRRAMRALDPTNDDPDFTNVERFRREGDAGNGTATFMADAQLPGKFGMTPAAKANWPLGEPATSAVAQVAARERRERAGVKTGGRKSSPMTPEARAAVGARLKAARAAKQAGPPAQGHAPVGA